MNPSDLVGELAQRLNLTGVTFANGVCRLIFDGSLAIDLEDDGAGRLTLHSVIATLPGEGRETVMATLLSAHLFGLETDGAVFGLHPQTHDIYLFRTLASESLEVDLVYGALEGFVHQVEVWRDRMAVIVREARPPAPNPVPPEAGSLRA